MTNRKKFEQAYIRNLTEDVAKYPKEYVMVARDIPGCVRRSLESLIPNDMGRPYNPPMQRACVEFGIPYHHAAVQEFING